MEKALLILNPKSGTQTAKNHFFAIVKELSEKYELTVHLTKSGKDIYETAQKTPYDTVIACGGDGTLSMTVDGLLNNPQKGIKLGYIPCGTANDVAATYGLSRKPAEAARAICQGKPVSIDTGRFGERNYIYTASFGSFTKASYETPQDVKNVFGNVAYFFSGVGDFMNLAEIPAVIECDEGKFEYSDIAFCAVGNTKSLGGGFVKFNIGIPELSDGKLDMLVVRKPRNLIELDRTVKEMLSGGFENEFVRLFHSSAYTVTTPEKHWTVDGEGVETDGPVRISCLNRSIEIIL